MVKYKFFGSIDNLKSILSHYDIEGTWKAERSGNGMKHVFRSVHGGIINWWTSSGTVNFQGTEPDCSALERALSQYLVTEDAEIHLECRQVTPILSLNAASRVTRRKPISPTNEMRLIESFPTQRKY